MAEPVVVDGVPVELTAAQQRRWDAGEQKKVTKEIRKARKQWTADHVDDHGELPDDYDTAVGDDS